MLFFSPVSDLTERANLVLLTLIAWLWIIGMFLIYAVNGRTIAFYLLAVCFSFGPFFVNLFWDPFDSEEEFIKTLGVILILVGTMVSLMTSGGATICFGMVVALALCQAHLREPHEYE